MAVLHGFCHTRNTIFNSIRRTSRFCEIKSERAAELLVEEEKQL